MTRGRGRALQGTAALLVAAMAASFTPTPLYPRYQQRWELSAGEVSVAFAAYAAGVLAVLLTLGGLSDRVGRLRALRWSGALLLVALAVLALAPSYQVLVAGRLLQGIATGVATSAGGAAMAELHPRGRHAGSLDYTLALGLGIAVGPLTAGLVASRLPAPYVTPYLVVGTATALATVALLTSPAVQAPASSGRVGRGIFVPRALAGPFAAAATAIAATNLCLGVMGTFGPDIAQSLGWQSSAAAGGLVSLVLVSVAATQVVGRSVPVQAGLVLSGATGVVGWSVLLAAVHLQVGAAALVGCALLGTGAGLGLLTSSAHVAALASPDRRAGVQAAYLVVAFTVLAGASLVLGPVVAAVSLTTALAVALSLAVMLTGVVAAIVARTRAADLRRVHG